MNEWPKYAKSEKKLQSHKFFISSLKHKSFYVLFFNFTGGLYDSEFNKKKHVIVCENIYASFNK